jgi:hypothetical protein
LSRRGVGLLAAIDPVERQSKNAPLGEPIVVVVTVVGGVDVVGALEVVVGVDVVGGVEVVGEVVVDAPGSQAASQQLPEPATPPLASQSSALALVEHRSTTGGHVELSTQAVTPSSHRPSEHVPASQIVHVTKPLFFPHVERAAQRVTAPLQLASRSPLRTASRT